MNIPPHTGIIGFPLMPIELALQAGLMDNLTHKPKRTRRSANDKRRTKLAKLSRKRNRRSH